MVRLLSSQGFLENIAYRANPLLIIESKATPPDSRVQITSLLIIPGWEWFVRTVPEQHLSMIWISAMVPTEETWG
jgi:hypothetical protein